MCIHCARCGQYGDWLRPAPTFGRQQEVYGYNVSELCRGCWRDLTDDPEVFDTELRSQSFNFFYSASAGTARKIVEDHEASHVLVSYATRNSGRIGTEDAHFVDCGGAPQSIVSNNGYETPAEDYLEYVEEVTTDNDLWALRDWPCASAALDAFDATVQDFQRRTVEAHQELLRKVDDYEIEAQPVAILQGETVKDYLEHANMMASNGTLTDYVAIGGIANLGPHSQQQIILAVREHLPERFDIHGLGVNLGGLRMEGVVDALASADSSYWYDYGGDNIFFFNDTATTEKNLDYSKATYEFLDHLKTVNEVVMDRDWNMDVDGTVPDDSGYFDDWVEFGFPTEPKSQLEPRLKQILDNMTFTGMDGSHHATTGSQQTTLPI